MNQLVRFGFFVLFLSLSICTCGLAQTMQDHSKDKCKQQPIGLFGQVTGASLKLSAEYNNGIHFMNEADLRENRWTLNALDEVDPTYKFLLLRNDADSIKEKCSDTIVVTGKLASPSGKLFDFKQATYSFTSRKLIFTTVERDGIVYEVEIQFFPEPVHVGGYFQHGFAKLKATGRSLGTVTMEFPIADVGSS